MKLIDWYKHQSDLHRVLIVWGCIITVTAITVGLSHYPLLVYEKNEQKRFLKYIDDHACVRRFVEHTPWYDCKNGYWYETDILDIVTGRLPGASEKGAPQSSDS